MNSTREYSIFDKLCLGVDKIVRALSHNVETTGAIYPAHKVENPELTDEQRKHSAGLMRVNHAGEICAQALYHGQSIVSRTPAIQAKLEQAAKEEGDHLAWCHRRLEELGSHTSYLNSFWYAGSFCIGMAAGFIGDDWSLGFVVETEKQVLRHLEKHLQLLPQQDVRSYEILVQMEKDERHHRDEANAAGARELPTLIQKAMALTSKVMVKTAYWI